MSAQPIERQDVQRLVASGAQLVVGVIWRDGPISPAARAFIGTDFA